MTRSGDSRWRSLLRQMGDRRPESQNLFRYLATEERPVATVTQLHPQTAETEHDTHPDTALGS